MWGSDPWGEHPSIEPLNLFRTTVDLRPGGSRGRSCVSPLLPMSFTRNGE
jgi:hypothetical protein